jgi:hypothetical protein
MTMMMMMIKEKVTRLKKMKVASLKKMKVMEKINNYIVNQEILWSFLIQFH